MVLLIQKEAMTKRKSVWQKISKKYSDIEIGITKLIRLMPNFCLLGQCKLIFRSKNDVLHTKIKLLQLL
jgi:hypothetical protein